MKIQLDTNIIMDILTERDGYANSLQVLRYCETKMAEGYVSAITITDVMYIMRKYRTADETREAVQVLLTILAIAGITSSDISGAFSCGVDDYEDAVQALCAKRSGASYIVTRNIKDFVNSPIPAVTPEDILPILRKQ